MKPENSFSIANPQPSATSKVQKVGLGLAGIGFLILLISAFQNVETSGTRLLILSFCFIIFGSLIFIVKEYSGKHPGIKNNGVQFRSLSSRGIIGWTLGVAITAFYVLLYWFPNPLEGVIRLLDPLSFLIRGKAANQWFLYGTFYTVSVLLMGFKFGLKYRHNKYQLIRTFSVSFFQLGFGFLIPGVLAMMNQPEFYFHYFWPLDSYHLTPNGVSNLLNHPGGWGLVMILISVGLTLFATPLLTYFFGKRWYCSWVCGCGGLAETAGDPFRHLSSKSLNSWKIERWSIHLVLVLVTVLTLLLWTNSAMEGSVLGKFSLVYSKIYGFAVSSLFAGVIGVGFYPILGSRIWCRFGCPMAAILGIVQKYFSRFRITTNGSQCISCGNCSSYCEMGIDVKWYAQRGQDIVRASCVGCGICSAVCPRGVLKLENGPVRTRKLEAQVSCQA